MGKLQGRGLHLAMAGLMSCQLYPLLIPPAFLSFLPSYPSPLLLILLLSWAFSLPPTWEVYNTAICCFSDLLFWSQLSRFPAFFFLQLLFVFLAWFLTLTNWPSARFSASTWLYRVSKALAMGCLSLMGFWCLFVSKKMQYNAVKSYSSAVFAVLSQSLTLLVCTQYTKFGRALWQYSIVLHLFVA